MPLSQIQLEAFQEVARAGSFTRAAAQLNLTQSALSHRIRNLEAELEAALFVRNGSGVKITEVGAKLLQFCLLQTQAEEELLQELKQGLHHTNAKGGELSGTVRIGGVSTVIRSLVVPGLSEFLRKHRQVRLELYTRELGEIPRLLSGGQVDFLVTTARIEAPGLIEEVLGQEENVLIESAKWTAPEDVFLDHDSEDQTTYAFLKMNGKRNLKLRRSFMDDIYGILDGVAEGLGRAVAPLHLVGQRKDLKVVASFKPLRLPIFLYRLRQPYYTRLHQAAHNEITKRLPKALRSDL